MKIFCFKAPKFLSFLLKPFVKKQEKDEKEETKNETKKEEEKL
ncbi:MAG: hypothetical protein SPF37_01055 [Eubacteriales bacterium]|nr:hypothetical protein [Eubacteriales bacterium]